MNNPNYVKTIVCARPLGWVSISNPKSQIINSISRFSPIKSSSPPPPENSAVVFSPPPEPDADFLARQRAARAERERLAEERDKLFVEFFGQPGTR